MDYDSLLGGVEYTEVNDTIMYGGNEIVVGGSVKSESRGKIIHLKYVPNDVKKLLAIINMARPVIFGHVEYDDGQSLSLKEGKKNDNDNDAAVFNMLRERLNRTPDVVVTELVHEYKLKEPVYWAITNLMQLLLMHIKNRRPRMRAIKIDGDIGEILDRVRSGDNFFKIATDHKDWPASIHAVVQELLEMLIRERMPKGNWREPELRSPTWPELCKKNIAAMNDVSKQKYSTVREYVEAIVLRENILMNHMHAVEMYYVHSAADINKYADCLASFLESAANPQALSKTDGGDNGGGDNPFIVKK